MHGSNIDRRVARTVSKLQDAHLALIRDHGYDAVGVDDICRAAGVSRSAFYAHYSGKDDLKRAGLEGLRRELIEAQRAARENGAARLAFSLPLLEHARDHLDLYRSLQSSRGGDVALAAVRDMLRDLVRRDLTASPRGAENDCRETTVEFLVGAFMAVLIRWLDDGATRCPRDVDAQFRRLARGGLGA